MLAFKPSSSNAIMTPAQFAAAVAGTGNILGFKIPLPGEIVS
jgi:hypothetical protein